MGWAHLLSATELGIILDTALISCSTVIFVCLLFITVTPENWLCKWAPG